MRRMIAVLSSAAALSLWCAGCSGSGGTGSNQPTPQYDDPSVIEKVLEKSNYEKEVRKEQQEQQVEEATEPS